MFRNAFATLSLSVAAAAVTLPMPALAQNWGAPAQYRAYDGDGFQQVAYRDRRDRRYSRNYRNDRNYGRCRDKGNGGLAIGGIAGGLLGNEVAGRGDKTLGTILGAGVGALAGRAVDKSDGRRC